MKAKLLFRFFITLLFLVSEIKSDIKVTKPTYNSNCNKLGRIDFTLEYARINGTGVSVPGLEILMINPDDPLSLSATASCNSVPYLDIFSCSFTPKEYGTYYPYLQEAQSFGNEKILPFNLSDYYTIVSSEAVGLIGSDQDITHDFGVEEEGKIIVEFEEAPTKPTTVIMNEKEIECTIDGKFQTCPFTREMFPVEEGETNVYSGEVLNFCGLIEYNITLTAKLTHPLTFFIKNFKDNQTKCNALANETELDLEYTYEGGAEIEDVKFDLQDKIKLKMKESETFVDMTCALEKKKITCSTIEAATTNGEYIAYLPEDFIYERAKGNYLFKAFTTTNFLNVHTSYSPISAGGESVIHDYCNGPGEFRFSYENELTEIPKATLDEKPLQCTTEKALLICPVTEEEYPTDVGYIPKFYYGELFNVCGQKERDLTIYVYHTFLNITFGEPVFTSPIEATGETVKFTIAINVPPKATQKISITDQVLSIIDKDYGVNIYPVTCEDAEPSATKLSCEIKDATEPGAYIVQLVEEKIIDTYRYMPFTSETEINLVKDYSKPTEESYEVTHDYLTSSEFTFDIKFQKPLGSYSPIVHVGEYDLECAKSEEVLTCTVYERYFPCEEGGVNKTYTGSVLNTLGLAEASVSISVFHSFYNVTFVTATFKDKIASTGEKIPINVTISVSQGAQGTISMGSTILGLDNLLLLTGSITCEDAAPTATVVKCEGFVESDSGEYYVVNSYDKIIDPYRFKEFQSGKYITVVKDYSKPEEEAYTFEHDYKVSTLGNFSITFQKELGSYNPKVVLGEKELTCGKSAKILICSFDEESFPAPENETKTYEGKIVNPIGEVDATIKLIISHSLHVVSFTNVEFSSKIEATGIDIPFKIGVILPEGAKDPLKMGDQVLSIKDKEMHSGNVSCQETKVPTEQVSCTIRNANDPGVYNVINDKDKEIKPYLYATYTSDETITLIKDYTRPEKKEYNFEHDYLDSKVGNFSISFVNQLGEYNPKISINQKEMNCSKFSNIMECSFDQAQFPCQEDGNITYYGKVENPIGEADAEITLFLKNTKPEPEPEPEPQSSTSFIFAGKICLMIGLLLLL